MSGEAVKVVVRCRPLNEREKRLNSEIAVAMDPTIVQVQLRKTGSRDAPPKLFTFDGVYFIQDTTQQIYEDICFPLVSGVLEGYNGTVFAYGQTGCGKSFTMMGVEDPPENNGIIPRAFGHIFDQVAVNTTIKYLVRASYLEIYNEEVRDLLARDSKSKLPLHENPDKGVYVQGLTHHKVRNVKDLEQVMELGGKNRSVGATLMNVDSSRSHSIFSIELEMLDSMGTGENGGGGLRAGKLNLVDLAGSERQSKTGSTGERLKEATKINLSLSALGNVISALVDGKSKHIPYRDSKLTRLLQSSLGGNTKTLMVACISPSDNNYDETLSTLRYANRAKNIKNKPKINEDPKDALLREYQEEIERLKKMLLGQTIPKNMQEDEVPKPVQDTRPPVKSVPSEDQLLAWQNEKDAIKKEYEAQLAEMKDQFGQEQANKAKLQDEFDRLKEQRDQQLIEAENKLHSITSLSIEHLTPQSPQPNSYLSASSLVPDENVPRSLPNEATSDLYPEGVTTAPPEATEVTSLSSEAVSNLPPEGVTTAPPEATEVTSLSSEAVSNLPPEGVSNLPPEGVSNLPPEGMSNLPPEGVSNLPPKSMSDESVSNENVSNIPAEGMSPNKDRAILREHELALQRLEELQNELIGGEKAADEDLKQHLQERQLAAQERQLQVTNATSMFDEDENVLEKIFNSLTDEVKVKTEVIERNKAKLESAEEDIKDLYTEFEIERQDYLSTIRHQERTMKLYEQLLETVVPCLRRDCNYFNMDKIKVECKWNEGKDRWDMPKLTVNKTLLAQTSPLPQPPLPKGAGHRDRKGKGTTPVHTSSRHSSLSDGSVRGSSSSLLRAAHGSAFPSSNSCDNLDEERHFGHFPQKSDESFDYFKPKRALELISHNTHSSKEGVSPIHTTNDLTPKSNAAAVHGVGDTSYKRRPPGKLQSLGRNPQVPTTFQQEKRILDKVDKKLASSRKGLEPLADIKAKR